MRYPLVDDQREARLRVLDTAEALFMQRGYTAVALRDLAEALGIKQASLYYHFPQGKEELYVAVTERAFARHGDGVRSALEGSTDLRARLRGIGRWFAGQPRMCLMGMIHADLPALSPDHRRRVEEAAAQALFQPVLGAVLAAQAVGEVGDVNPFLFTGAFLALLDASSVGETLPARMSRSDMSDALIDLLLDGAIDNPSASAPARGAQGS